MVKTPAAPKTDAKSGASQIPASEASAFGATAPATSETATGQAGGGPRITVDQNAPADPLIRSETETLRADAAASGQATSGQAAPAGDVAAHYAAADPAPIVGLGDGDRRTSPFPDAAFQNDAIPAGDAAAHYAAASQAGWIYQNDAAAREFSRAGAAGAIKVRVMGVAGDFVELGFYDASNFLQAAATVVAFAEAISAAPRSELYFFDRDGYENVNVVEPGPAGDRPILRLVYPSPRPLNGADALLVLGAPVAGRAPAAPEYVEIPAVTAAAASAEVPPAAPAVQPTAVVDPAFLRVAASACVVKAVGAILTINTEIRSEPGHDYGVRYVDVDGAPRITRIEPFVGPTSVLTLAADLPAPLVGADVQIGVLGAPIDVATGEALIAGKYLSLREHGDGTATAVTVDGRKVRVGAL